MIPGRTLAVLPPEAEQKPASPGAIFADRAVAALLETEGRF